MSAKKSSALRTSLVKGAAVVASVALMAGLPAANASASTTSTTVGSVTVAPATGLNRDGQEVTVTVANVPAGKGIYVMWCPNNPAGTRQPAGTCSGTAQVWTSTSQRAVDAGAKLFTGSVAFAVTPTITNNSGTVDCLAGGCSIFIRLDHFSPGDVSLDTFIPVTFAAKVLPPVTTSSSVFFAPRSAVLTPAGKRALDALVATAKSGTVSQVSVTGYIQRVTSRPEAANLAAARARAVAAYLASKGITVTSTKGSTKRDSSAQARRAVVSLTYTPAG